MLRTHYASAITEKHEGTRVTVAGWVKTKRDLGKVLFIVLQDGTGELQITAKRDQKKGVFEALKSLGSEWVVVVTGTVAKQKSAPGGRELVPDEVRVINKAESPLPFDTHKFIDTELDTRLDHRYLDLRRPETRAVFRVKDTIQTAFMGYFNEQDFVTVNPPVIVAAATESGAALFPISYFEREAFLAQSPQLYKQMLMASGLDKVCIVTPVFRAEEHDTSFHLNEVVQMDIEVAFVENEEDVLRHLEGVVHRICEQVKKECAAELELLGVKRPVPKLPIKRLTYDEALRLLEKDGMKLQWGEDLTREAEQVLCKRFDPVIVTKWPTKARAFYSMPEPGNEKICRSYDLLFGGMEIASGAQRIHDKNQLEAEMKKRKMSPKNFEFYVNAFRFGMPPHAGWSIGLERLTMVLTGKRNIREVSLHPRTRTRLTP
ncbi:MAG: aspartate--tRNA(Asn) ligase [Candidatus Aenigmarchaeota archaeon]|nr:aspartate--tRNA(Asn) ligase [Candidatus Aenigmarchaeota archaeon]